jgi:PemK-like, MazF-like toxin of type II toxin-antitoxin system
MELYATAAGGVLLALALVAGAVALRRRTRPQGRPAQRPSSTRPSAPGRLPEPREIWWAVVPFEDGPGGKDRPCLVLHRGARTATVLKITSKHHAELAGVIPLPPGAVGDREHRASWLETGESREVPFADFRRRVGAVDPQLWTRVGRARRR